MIPSGHISDSVLFACLERDFVLKPSTRKLHHIVFYARFRDDILLIVNNSNLDSIRVLLDEIKRHASPFIIKLESISRNGFQMLDLDAQVGWYSDRSFGRHSYTT